jgi:hypothetical protein
MFGSTTFKYSACDTVENMDRYFTKTFFKFFFVFVVIIGIAFGVLVFTAAQTPPADQQIAQPQE